MEPASNETVAGQPCAWYREFVPGAALRPHVYALFSFGPEPPSAAGPRAILRELAFRDAVVCAPQLADGHVSIRFELGRTFGSAGRWRTDSHAAGGTVIGPMSGVGRTGGLDLSETVGAFFRPGSASRFLGRPISDLADTAVPVGDLWGTRAARLSSELAASSAAARLDRLESMLLARLRHGRPRAASLDVEGLAADVRRKSGRLTVEEMARAAGVSRQHLSRTFRERIGIGPKLYGRLARFQAVLAHAGARSPIDWARVAVDAGFADQSHLIAECRQFSGLTPRALAARDWFHPFIERAKSRRRHVDQRP